jgi:hypothetical protein
MTRSLPDADWLARMTSIVVAPADSLNDALQAISAVVRLKRVIGVAISSVSGS